jgi:23S rRNA (uracil1939-C5)-methyltransferase
MSCKHFPECGGCTLQHLPYLQQLDEKRVALEKTFNRPVPPLISCKDPWEYRNKMEFSFSQNKAQDRFFGLILKKTRGHVFNLEECRIAPPWFAKTLQNVKQWWDSTTLTAYNPRNGLGCLRTLTLRQGMRTGQRLAMLTVSGDPNFAPKRRDIDSFVKVIGEGSIFLRIQQCKKGFPTQFFEMHLQGPDHIQEELHLFGRTFTYKISPTSFFQPNTFQAEAIYTQALSLLNPASTDLVYDLYCGTATLGMAIALSVQKVVAIELNPHAVFDAKTNCEMNQIPNLEIICGDVGKVLSTLPTPDIAILDPPRSGLDATATSQLLRLKPHKILYISCNPQTQFQNIQALSSYRILHMQPVDQFPHTNHIENIIVLEKI